MRNLVLVLLFIGSFTVQAQNLSESKAEVEDLSLLPSTVVEDLPFTMCSRTNDQGTNESVGIEDGADMAYWVHVEGGMLVVDYISIGYAIAKCDAWERHAKLKKADD